MSEVEVIVPHRSRWDLLARLLKSLHSQNVRPAICVIDNASTDSTLAELTNYPGVRTCRSSTNLGFGRAVNLGVRSSTADFVITLNNDMEAEREFVASMLHELRRVPQAAVGAVQLRPDGNIDTIGVAVDQSLCAYDVGHGLALDALESETLTPIGPSGGAAGFRRDVFLKLGGYDERIFAYLEDADLAIRLHAAGVTYHVALDARVWHRHSATLGSGSYEKNKLMGWSRGYMLWKYGRYLSAPALLRGAVIDGTVYLGQATIDRNLGAVRGRIAFARSRPDSSSRSSVQPMINDISVYEALRRRFHRR